MLGLLMNFNVKKCVGFFRLRSPKAPDDSADMGSHSFTYAVMPHTGASDL